METVISNLTEGFIVSFPSLYSCMWVFMFQYILNTKSGILSKESFINKLGFNIGLVCLWSGLLITLFTPVQLGLDVILVRYGIAFFCTFKYFYYKNNGGLIFKEDAEDETSKELNGLEELKEQKENNDEKN